MSAGRKPISDEYLLKKLAEASSLVDHPITERDIESMPGFPSKSVYQRHFGSFNEAKRICNVIINLPGGDFWKHKKTKGGKKHRGREYPYKMRFFILHRDKFTCQYCGRTPQDGAKLVVDHINPVSNGGKGETSNLITSCWECNMGKFNQIIFSKKENPADES